MVKVIVKDALGAGIIIGGGSVWSERFNDLGKIGDHKDWITSTHLRQTVAFTQNFKLISDFHLVKGNIVELDSITGRKGDALLFSATGISFQFDMTGAFKPDARVLKGNDIVTGNRFGDYAQLGAGNDRFTGNAGNDESWGQAGDDRLDGGAGSDVLIGGDGEDTLFGGTQNDLLLGDGGKDRLFGGDANDNLDGKAGQDILTGGAGADTFFFATAGHSGKGAALRDQITDLEAKDHINLRDVASGLQFGDGPSAKGVWVVTEGALQIVRVDTSGDAVADMEIAVQGVELTASQFILV